MERLSELRMVELLEGLCGRMKLYTWGSTKVDEGAALQQGWTLKQKAVRDISLGISRAEEKVKQKELASYCGRLIEEHEDELVEAIQKEKFDEETGLKELLCVKLAGVCERKTDGVPSIPDEL